MNRFTVERLEQLKLMSAANPEGCLVEILAAGSTGEEIMSLQIDGVTVATFENVAGDVETRDFQSFSFQTDVELGDITADRIRVVFENDANDYSDPDNIFDRDLVVDSIAIDGEVFETEAATTFSTGTWLAEDGVTPGFRGSEFLTSNGYLQYQAVTLSTASDAVTVDESAGIATITVNRAGELGAAVSVEYTTNAGTAGSGDFTAASGVLAFEAGAVSADIEIAITDDADAEGDESFTVDLTNSANATLGAATTTVTISANDVAGSGPGELAFEVASVDINEDAGVASVTVSRTGGAEGEVGVSYATTDGTAEAGSDYVATSGTLTFAEGENTATIEVALIDDADQESSEDLTLTLSDPTGEATLGTSALTINIIDDESLPTISVFANGSIGTEDLQLLIDDVVVAEVTDVGTSNTGAVLTYTASGPVTADQVKVAFINAVFTDEVDENLIVDRIEIDGVAYETEAPTTFSTGTWNPVDNSRWKPTALLSMKRREL